MQHACISRISLVRGGLDSSKPSLFSLWFRSLCLRKLIWIKKTRGFAGLSRQNPGLFDKFDRILDSALFNQEQHIRTDIYTLAAAAAQPGHGSLYEIALDGLFLVVHAVYDRFVVARAHVLPA
jgi:hypothetical protein